MREPILMPSLSDTMETGHLVDWLKQPGDAVKKGEAIAEVETDKAVMDVEAFHDGYLAGPLAEPDTDIPVGKVIGYLVDSPDAARTDGDSEPAAVTAAETPAVEAAPPTEPSAPTAKPEPESAPTPAPAATVLSGQGIPASPYARGLARDLGMDLSTVTPGPSGIVTAAEVLVAAVAPPQPNLDDGPDYELQPPSPMQRAVANNMQAAAATPSFRVGARLSLAPLQALAHETGHSLTLLLARACALTVEAHPQFNAVYTPRGLARRERIDVGIAVDVPRGLVTPVLRDVARRPIEELDGDWRDLKRRAQGRAEDGRRLHPRDYRGATFYLSNLGTFAEVNRFDAVVPLGAAAILAVAAMQDDGLCEFTLSCDHRVVYGADAARFLQTLAQLLGAPRDETRLHGSPSGPSDTGANP